MSDDYIWSGLTKKRNMFESICNNKSLVKHTNLSNIKSNQFISPNCVGMAAFNIYLCERDG